MHDYTCYVLHTCVMNTLRVLIYLVEDSYQLFSSVILGRKYGTSLADAAHSRTAVALAEVSLCTRELTCKPTTLCHQVHA